MHSVNLMPRIVRTKSSAVICFVLVLSLILVCESSLFVQAAGSSFGYVSVGSSNKSTFGGLYVSNFTSPPDLGNITQIQVYLATGGTPAKAVIYSDKNGAPDALLAKSDETSITGTSGSWVSFSVSYAGSPNTVYWLGVVLVNAGTYYYSSGVSGRAVYSASETGAPSTFPSGNISLEDGLSIYAVYDPSLAPASSEPNFNLVQTLLLLVAVVGLIVLAILAVVYLKTKKNKKT
jgi:hypothetical protein